MGWAPGWFSRPALIPRRHAPPCLDPFPDIEPPDVHYVRAAEGWLELDCPGEAAVELAQVGPSCQDHPLVLWLHCQTQSAAGEWARCARTAERLVGVLPDDPRGWIQRSYALHELKRTREAYELLLAGLPRFPNPPVTLPYNLACYACQMGDQASAWRWLGRAQKLGGAEAIKAMALEDLDLEPLWTELRAG